MIQVIERAFVLLKEMSRNSEKIWTVRELAQLISVRTPTCCNILNTLVSLDVVEHIGKRKGYRAGKGLAELCGGHFYHIPVQQKAETLFRKFVLSHEVLIELTVLDGNLRHILCQADSSHPLQIRHNVMCCDDVLMTISGKLLLAHLPCGERMKFLQSVSPLTVPEQAKDLWPERLDEAGFMEELDRVAEKNMLLRSVGGIQQIAFPVYNSKNRVETVISCVLPAYRFEPPFRETLLRDIYTISVELGKA